MGEKEKWNSLSIVKRWHWRLEGGERLPVEWRALPPGAMVRSQPELPLGAMSRSVTMQWQGSVTHITAREPSKSLVRAAAEDHMDVQGLCRTGPTPH